MADADVVMRDGDDVAGEPEVKGSSSSPGEPVVNLGAAAAKKLEGNGLYQQRNYRAAIEKYTEAINMAPTESSYLGNRAAAHMMMENFKLAADDCLKAVELDRNFIKAYSRGAKCLTQLGRLDEALSFLHKAPSNPDLSQEISRIQYLMASFSQAKECVNSNQSNKALPMLQTLCKSMSQCLQLQLLLADALLSAQKYEDALKLCSRLVGSFSSNSDILRVRGTALYYLGRHDQAIRHFQEVMRMDPDNKQCLTMFKRVKKLEKAKQAGNDAFKAGKMRDAYQLYSDALDVDPNNTKFNAVLYSNRAAAAIKLRKYHEAVIDCDKALQVDANNIKALVRRATARLETEDFEGAVRDFESAGQLDPSSRNIHEQIRHAKLELKKSKRKDYYKILGVEKDADERAIKKAYRRQALIHHPDKNQGGTEAEKKAAEEKFKDVGEAYAILSDSEKRRRYDSGVDLEDGMGGGFSQEVDVNQVFQMFFGGGGMGGMGGGHQSHGGHYFRFG